MSRNWWRKKEIKFSPVKECAIKNNIKVFQPSKIRENYKEILDENGYVKVNDILETNIKGVYAIGDIIKKDTYQLVTAASDGASIY